MLKIMPVLFGIRDWPDLLAHFGAFLYSLANLRIATLAFSRPWMAWSIPSRHSPFSFPARVSHGQKLPCLLTALIPFSGAGPSDEKTSRLLSGDPCRCLGRLGCSDSARCFGPAQ